MNMVDILLGSGENHVATYIAYTIIGVILGSICHFWTAIKMQNRTYRTKDGVEMNHDDLMLISGSYRKLFERDFFLNPFKAIFYNLLLFMALFMAPGMVATDYRGDVFYVIPHFLLSLTVVCDLMLSKSYSHGELKKIAESEIELDTTLDQLISRNRKVSDETNQQSVTDEKSHSIFSKRLSLEQRLRLLEENRSERLMKAERDELEIEIEYVQKELKNVMDNWKKQKKEFEAEQSQSKTFETKLSRAVPYPLAVIEEIASDESLPTDIRQEALDTIRGYNEKQRAEKEQARIADARLSLDVARKMLNE